MLYAQAVALFAYLWKFHDHINWRPHALGPCAFTEPQMKRAKKIFAELLLKFDGVGLAARI